MLLIGLYFFVSPKRSGILLHKPNTFDRTFGIRGHYASNIRGHIHHKHSMC